MRWLLALLLWQTMSDPTVPEKLRYERPVLVEGTGQACAALDPAIFPHAAPSLRDLRLFAAGREIPYTITLSHPAEEGDESARVLNLRMGQQSIAFDLEMPDRPYTDVRLDLGGRDYTVTATVSAGGRELGTFTVFDMTTERLARNTTLALPESHLRSLHIVLAGPGPLPSVLGAVVPPSREAQTVYAVAAQTSSISRRGTDSVAKFRLPARVPVERILVTTSPSFRESFSRHVRVTARSDAKGSATETIEGQVARVSRADRRLDAMSFSAALGANLQTDAMVEVSVENGEEKILPIASITLEMRQRELCFDAFGGAPMLLYGARDLPAPGYRYAAGFVPSQHPLRARFGAERTNPQFRSLTDERPLRERMAEWMWMGLVLMIGVVGTLGLRHLRRRQR